MSYWFDNQAADRVERFFSHLVHVKGELAGQRVEWQPWQTKVIRDLFGWKRADGTRRYRMAYMEMGRKNGKTTFAAGIALYLLCADGEEGAEVYSCAGDRDQAGICYDIASQMIYRVPFLRRGLEVQPGYKRVRHHNSGSVYRVLSSDAKGKHGYNPSGIIFDELHTQPNRELWEVMETGKGARRQPLTFAITTAGYDRSSICWELHEKAKRHLDGDATDPTFYPVIFAADEADDWMSEDTWRKACPNLGVSVPVSFLEDECCKAKESPAYENTFRRLFLSQWTEQDVRWLPMHKWDECTGVVDEDELHGQPCWGGLDLAMTRDLSAFAIVWRLEDRYAVRCWFWSPAGAATARDAQDRRQVRNWAERGLVTLTEGDTQDHRRIQREIVELCEQYDVEAIAIDQASGGSIMTQELQDEHGLDVERFTQTPGNYNPLCELLESLVTERKLEHFGDPVLRWNASNVALSTPNSRGEVMPNKGRSGDKIDGIVATLMAMGLAVRSESDVVYDEPQVFV